MGRHPKYSNPEKITAAFIAAVAASYRSGGLAEDADKHKPQVLVAEEFGISRLKVRKILITTGDYKSPMTEEILRLKEQGKKPGEICEMLGIGRSTLNSYLPYEKGVYKLEGVSAGAERVARWRERKKALSQKCC